MPKGQYTRVYKHAPNFRDLSGQRFGKRVVISWNSSSVHNEKKGSSLWNVICDCGKTSVIPTSTLKATSSCGCDIEYAARSGATRKSRNISAPRNVSHLKRTFGLSVEEFERRRMVQDNKCRICKEVFVVTPSVDHDHTCCSSQRSCGKCIRGLLCKRCNAALGGFHDQIDLLETAIVYLKEHQKTACITPSQEAKDG